MSKYATIIELPIAVHGAKDEVEARETLLRVMTTGIDKMNNQLEAEGGKIWLSLPKLK